MNNYLYSDFVFLCAAAKKKSSKLSDVFTSASAALQFPFTREQLLHALSSLRAGGYIVFNGENVLSDMTLTVTDKASKAVKVGFPSSLFASSKNKALLKLEGEFTTLSYDLSVGELTLHDDEYVAVNRKLYAEYSVFVPFVEMCLCDGLPAFRFRSAECGYSPAGATDAVESDRDDTDVFRDSLDIVCKDAKHVDGLLSAVYDFLLVSSKVRKFALEGTTGTYLFSLSYVDAGARLTAARILYNKQRFIGKRDSDLDYAQCSENLLDITIAPALLSAAVLRAYSSADTLLTPDMLEKMKKLRSSGV